MEGSASLVALSGMVVAASLLGGILPLLRKLKETTLHILLGFSAGVLLGAAFFLLLPEAQELIKMRASYFALLGMLAVFLIDRYVMVHACATFQWEFHPLGVSAFVGLSFHSLSDGLALGAGALVPALTPAILVAILVHKVPDGLSLSTMLLEGKYPRPAVVALNVLFSLTTPLGAILAMTVLQGYADAALGGALAFSAGTFLHLSLSSILPEIHRHSRGKPYPLIALVLGLGVMWLARVLPF